MIKRIGELLGITKINHCSTQYIYAYIYRLIMLLSGVTFNCVYFSDNLASNSPILIIMYHLGLTPGSYKMKKAWEVVSINIGCERMGFSYWGIQVNYS